MLTIYYTTDRGGICIQAGSWPTYVGYGKREAFRKFRKDYGLERRHIEFIDNTPRPGNTLTDNIARLIAANRRLAELEAAGC